MSTIRDVSKLSGVSIATISRVLSNDPNFKVSDETKQKIMDAVSALNYVYKPKGKNTKIKSLGCVMSVSFDYYSDPFFKSILNAIESNMNAYNFDSIITLNYNEVLNHNPFIESVLNQVDGLIIMESLPNHVISYLKSKVDFLVSIDTSYADIPSIGYNLLEANQSVMRHLIDYGYKNIAYVGGSTPEEPIEDSIRMMVYREALRKHGLQYNDDYIIDCQWNIDTCAKETRKLLEEHPEIDAIFAGSDTLANAILGLLYDMDISCPKDIGIIGFNNNEGSSLSIPPLTTVNVPSREIGLLALKVLSESIESSQSSPISYKLPTSLVIRSTTQKQ